MDDTASASSINPLGLDRLPDGPPSTRHAGGLVNTPEPALLGPRGAVAQHDYIGSREWFATIAKDRHPATSHLMRYFAWTHLPDPLRAVSAPFGSLASALLDQLPDGPELTTALRKLVEAKDCAIRAMVDKLSA